MFATRFQWLTLCGLLSTFAADAAGADLKRDGAFGFPQAEARVLCDTDELRLSVWSNAEYLYVQAVVWKDGDDSVGQINGRETGDVAMLTLDVDTDRQRTRLVDRSYFLTRNPASLPGLLYQVVVNERGSTGLQSDSRGRGAIRYLAGTDGGKHRVDCFLIPLAEIGKQVDETVRFSYWARSPKPDLTVNSVGFESTAPYFPAALPMDKFHEVKLVKGITLDSQLVPEDRPPATTNSTESPAPALTLTIGSSAPALNIEHWVQNGKGKFSPVTEFTPGKVYIVEFWATWCGPCIAAMPHIVEIQQKYADQGLQVVSISDEKLDIVEKFLERNAPAAKGKAPVTFGELTSHYCLTTDPDRSNHDNYMKAAGRNGIPCAFIVGMDGFIEWIGHPMSIDKALAGVITGNWDRAAFAVEYKQGEELSRKSSEIMALAIKGRFEDAVAMATAIRDNSSADVIKLRAEALLRSVRGTEAEHHILRNSQQASAKLEALLEGRSSNDVNSFVWDKIVLVMQGGRKINDEVLATATRLTEQAVKTAPEEPHLLDTYAHLLQLQGQLDKAIEIQHRAVKHADKADERVRKPIEDYLQTLLKMKNPTADGQSGTIGPVQESTPPRQVSSTRSAAPAPLRTPKSQLHLENLKSAKIELVSGPDLSLELATFRSQGRAVTADYVPSNPALVPLVTAENPPYKVVDGGLSVGAVPYTDRVFKITELPDALRGLTLVQTRMGHKGIVDGRFSIVLATERPCYLFVALRDETLNIYNQSGVPFWLQEFSSTDFTLLTDNPLRGVYRIYVRYVPAGRIALGPCCSDPGFSSMYFAFAAEAK